MKHLIIISLLFCSQLFALDLSSYQVVRVMDVNNELVTGAKVEIPGTDYVYYTNIKGECYIPTNILNKFNTIHIDCISYKTVKINTRDLNSKIMLEFR